MYHNNIYTYLSGPPRRLVLVREAGEAWAGSQAFGAQPIVQVHTHIHTHTHTYTHIYTHK
jgi:hypothetical protein